jgi:hypothetical protein
MYLAALTVLAGLFMLAGTAASAAGPVGTWAKKYPGLTYLFSVDRAADNGFIVAGDAIQGGHRVAWIYRLDDQGNMGWQKTFGTTMKFSFARQTPDGGFIAAGSYSPTGYGAMPALVKLDGQGNVEWQKSYGTMSAFPTSFRSIRTTADNGFIAGGIYLSDTRGPEIFVMKFDESGNAEWQKTYGGMETDMIVSLEQTRDGGFLLAATTSSYGDGGTDAWFVKLDPSGEIEWQKTYSVLGTAYWKAHYGRVIQQTADGGYVFVTSTTLTPGGVFSIWVVKLDAAGVVEWQKAYGSGVRDTGVSIEQTGDNGYIVGASTQSGFGNEDSMLLKLDESGGIVWQHTYGYTGFDWLYHAQATADGGYILSGWDWSFTGTFHLLKTDENGLIAGCASMFVGPSTAVAVDTAGTVLDSNAVPGTIDLAPASIDIVVGETNASAEAVCQETGPRLAVAPAALDFGPVEVFGSATRTLTLTNTVDAPVTISQVAVAGLDAARFSQTNTCASLTGAGSCTITVTMSPATLGAKSAVLAIASNDPASPLLVSLTGTGTDATPPVITAIVEPGAASGGCHGSDVTVSFLCSDALSGIASCSAPVLLASEGAGQVVTGTAVDLAGNRASVSVTVSIDKTAPEAVIRFDAATRDIVVVNSETNAPAAYTVIAAKHGHADDGEDDDDDGDAGRHEQRDLRQYVLDDCAGNTLTLILKVRHEGHEVKAGIISMQYNSGPAARPAKNKLAAEYSFDKNGELRELEQKVSVKKQFEVEAKYRERRDETTIKADAAGGEDRKETRAGLVVVEMATDKGALGYRY